MSESKEEADKAWVRIGSALSPSELAVFCQDPERLLRINSLYEFESWRDEGGGRFFLRARNLSNDRIIATPLRVERRADGVTLVYGAGLKRATDFRVEPPLDEHGAPLKAYRSVLVITDDYSGSAEAELRARSDEIDKSLLQWGHDLHRYLRHWARWSRFSLWRWYMRRIWQPMKPAGRRITLMLVAITAFELAAAAAAIALFALGILRW